MNDNNEDMNATEKFTGTMDVQDKLKSASISKVVIERAAKKLRLTI